jgi:excisionase family DNA binding protein
MNERQQTSNSRGEWITVHDVAEILKVTPAWVRAHANGNRKPTLPSVKVGKHRRFRKEAIQEFMKSLETALNENGADAAG